MTEEAGLASSTGSDETKHISNTTHGMPSEPDTSKNLPQVCFDYSIVYLEHASQRAHIFSNSILGGLLFLLLCNIRSTVQL